MAQEDLEPFPESVDSLSCISFLDAYPYPAFILTAAWSNDEEPNLYPTYVNPASNKSLFYHPIDSLIRTHSFTKGLFGHVPTFLAELFWGVGVVPVDVTKTMMGPNIWVCTTLPRKSLRDSSELQKQVEGESVSDRGHNSRLEPQHERCVSTQQLIDAYDWAAVPGIGPRDSWTQSFKTIFDMVFDSPHPVNLYWGKDARGFYNESYIKLVGKKHPQMWGQPVVTAWREAYPYIQEAVEAVLSGTPTNRVHDLFFIDRLTDDLLPEETYFVWSYVPVYVEDGSVGGFVNSTFETTETVIAERRANCLRDAITATVLTTSPREFGEAVIQTLSKEEYHPDVSFAALYLCAIKNTVKTGGDTPVAITFELNGSIGIPENHWSKPGSVLIHLDISAHDPARLITFQMDSRPSSRSHITDPVTFPWPFAQAIKSRKAVHMECLDDKIVFDYERRSWSDKPREAVVIPIGFDDDGIPNAVLILGINTRRPYDHTYKTDIDVLRMTLSSTLHATLSREAELNRARHLAELDAAKTTFFSNASHELRTPLTLIGGPIEQCLNRASDRGVKKSLKIALRNVHRLERLVDSLMDFSKLAANRLEGQFRPAKLGIITAELASMFRSSVEKGGLTYKIECDTDPNQQMCYVDSDFWERIVFNLVGNAFKYTLSGSITVSLVNDATGAIFTVQDTGCGIPKDEVDNIFQRFYRVQATSRSYEGTGIGLALTKELVALLGGELRVESNSDPKGPHGTTFTTVIPYAKTHLLESPICEGNSATEFQGKYARGCIEQFSMWGGHTSNSGDSEDLHIEEGDTTLEVNNALRLDSPAIYFQKSDLVLLVDDNVDMRQYARSILSPYCTVIEAVNGKDALEKALAHNPDVILSDVMMPVMGGFELVAQLRERKETMLISIILLTARSGDENQVEGLLSGADDYLVKPFKPGELVARVHLQMQLGKKRVKMEELFNKRTREIQQLSELAPVAIFRADQSGSIKYVNPRWYTITGLPKNDANMSDWIEMVDSGYKPMVSQWWMEACRSEVDDAAPTTIDFCWSNGNWCRGHCVSTTKEGALGTLTDISKQKELEVLKLNNARKRAEDAEEQRKQADDRRRSQELLIDVTSHELRQPVSAILNCSEFVRENLASLHEQLLTLGVFTASSPPLKAIRDDLNALDAIYQCGLAQERIANDVLSLSRTQLQVLSIIPVNFDLAAEVERIVALFHIESKMKNIKLKVILGESLRHLGIKYVRSDKARFAQVITNLLCNAIKFTDTSKSKRDIVIKVEVGLDQPVDAESCEPPPSLLHIGRVAPDTTLYIYVSVTDSGPGLAPDDLSLLFQRFQQGSNSHEVFGGSGLGLFVSKQLCSLMGGRIGVCSPPGEGATFQFFIQVTTAAPPISLSSPTTPVPLSPTVSHPISVLITEDNEINRSILNRQLRKAGCTTILAKNGKEAVDALRNATEPIDVVLMDIEMPVMDGPSAVRKIRSLEATGVLSRRHCIYALTANAREAQVESIREAGVDDVIIKPYKLEELVAKLHPHAP